MRRDDREEKKTVPIPALALYFNSRKASRHQEHRKDGNLYNFYSVCMNRIIYIPILEHIANIAIYRPHMLQDRFQYA